MLRVVPAVSLAALLSFAPLGLAGCSEDPAPTETESVATSPLEEAADFDVTLPWGDAPGAMGRRAPRAEFLGDGPSGIAVTPAGAVRVADRLHGRLVAVDATGAHGAQPLDADVEALAIGDDGVVALFSPVRSRVGLQSADGTGLGEVAVPRVVGDVVGLSVRASHRVEVETAFQERFVAGSPLAPLDANGVLRTKREGAMDYGDHHALEAVVDANGTAFVVVVATPDGDRAHEERRIEVARRASSIRLVGVDGGRAVAVVEHVDQAATGALSVTRALTVVDLDGGRALASEPMVGGGAWVPRQAIAFGGGAVAYMVPLPDGLRVLRQSVDALVARGGVK